MSYSPSDKAFDLLHIFLRMRSHITAVLVSGTYYEFCLRHIHRDRFSGISQIKIFFSKIQMKLTLFFFSQLPQIIMAAGMADRIDIFRSNALKILCHERRIIYPIHIDEH